MLHGRAKVSPQLEAVAATFGKLVLLCCDSR